jgi:hypothetical protein
MLGASSEFSVAIAANKPPTAARWDGRKFGGRFEYHFVAAEFVSTVLTYLP